MTLWTHCIFVNTFESFRTLRILYENKRHKELINFLAHFVTYLPQKSYTILKYWFEWTWYFGCRMSFRNMTVRNHNILLSSHPPYSKPGLPDPLFNTSTFSSFRETVRSIFDTVLPKLLEPFICGNSKLIFDFFAKKRGLIFKFVKVSSHGYIFN